MLNQIGFVVHEKITLESYYNISIFTSSLTVFGRFSLEIPLPLRIFSFLSGEFRGSKIVCHETLHYLWVSTDFGYWPRLVSMQWARRTSTAPVQPSKYFGGPGTSIQLFLMLSNFCCYSELILDHWCCQYFHFPFNSRPVYCYPYFGLQFSQFFIIGIIADYWTFNSSFISILAKILQFYILHNCEQTRVVEFELHLCLKIRWATASELRDVPAVLPLLGS